MKSWHHFDTAKVLQELGTSRQQGLSADEVLKRRKNYGANILVGYQPPNLFFKFLRQFHNLLIYSLLASALITFFLKHWVDGTVILGVVIINAIFGVFQEGKAEKALKSIRNVLATNALVLRDGQKVLIPVVDLVPGDIVFLKTGDKIPADLRLIESKSLQVQEAILTGESAPIEKNTVPCEIQTPLPDRTCMVYSATLVIYGRGIGVVVAIGKDTEVGKISDLLVKTPGIETPLLARINVFGRWLALAIFLMGLVTFLVGLLIWNDPTTELFIAVVALIVAAIPEGLPPLMTIVLAVGITRMARHNAIVRSLPAVEAMGSVTTICTDKTGTLTLNEMRVENVVTARNAYQVFSQGVKNWEIFTKDDEEVFIASNHDLNHALQAAMLCNDSEITSNGSESQIHGNPLDNALLELGEHTGLKARFARQNFPRIDLIPYESEHKFMATLNHDHEGRTFIYVKGAPEKILSICRKQQLNGEIENLNHEYWNQQLDFLTNQGQRAVAIAYREIKSKKNSLNFADIDNDLTLLAIFGLLDPPRDNARRSVFECYQAGINVKMITGDHLRTALTIASKIGIDTKGGVLTGEEIESLDEATFMKKVKEVNVYARTSAQHKLRLVKALQNVGEIVAMTGDGVNDAPALRNANIGIAMGKRGTDIAKETADIVLSDDNFATIVNAVREGRTIYNNLKKTILFILPSSFALGLVIVMAVLFNWTLPVSAVQILWINTITSVNLAIALGFEPITEKVMREKPHPIKEPIMSRFLAWRTILVSLLFVASVFGIFLYELSHGASLHMARTAAVNMMVMAQVVYLLNCRDLYRTIWSWDLLFENQYVLIAISSVLLIQMIFTYFPPMEHFFLVTSLGINSWGRIFLVGIIIYLIIELEKVFVRFNHGKNRNK